MPPKPKLFDGMGGQNFYWASFSNSTQQFHTCRPLNATKCKKDSIVLFIVDVLRYVTEHTVMSFDISDKRLNAMSDVRLMSGVGGGGLFRGRSWSFVEAPSTFETV